jgi:hypothetical protein
MHTIFSQAIQRRASMNCDPAIEAHIRRYGIAHSVAMGETIAHVIAGIWNAAKPVARYLLAQAKTLTTMPEYYSTSLTGRIPTDFSIVDHGANSSSSAR